MSNFDDDEEGLIGLMQEITPELKALPAETEQKSYSILTTSPEEEWVEDAVPVKINKIRAAVLNAKTASEVKLSASLMKTDQWLDCIAKLMPKQVDVQSVQITAIRVELPPRDNQDKDVIEVEMPR